MGEAQRLGHSQVGSRHLLLGLLRLGKGGGGAADPGGPEPRLLYRQTLRPWAPAAPTPPVPGRGEYTPPASSPATRLLDQHARDMVQTASRGAMTLSPAGRRRSAG